MLRHIEKQVKKHTLEGGDVLPVGGSDSDSDSDSSESNSSSSQSDDDDCDQSGVPESLLNVLDDPLRDLKSRNTLHSDEESSESCDDNPSETENEKFAIKVCVICPGKQLKTQELATGHLKSKVFGLNTTEIIMLRFELKVFMKLFFSGLGSRSQVGAISNVHSQSSTAHPSFTRSL